MDEYQLSDSDIKRILILACEEEIEHHVNEEQIIRDIKSIPDYRLNVERTRVMSKYFLVVTLLLLLLFIGSLTTYIYFGNPQIKDTNLLLFNLLSVAGVLFSIFTVLEFEKHKSPNLRIG